MAKTLEIKLTKCLLVLTEQELMQCLALKPDVFEVAIGQGKSRIRHETAVKRQLRTNAEGFDRWRLYEVLRDNFEANNDVLNWVLGMNEEELREGVIEFLIARNRQAI